MSTTNQKNPLAPNLYTYQYVYKGQSHEGTYTVFAYNYNPDGVCTFARKASSYASYNSAYHAAVSLKHWYDEVIII